MQTFGLVLGLAFVVGGVLAAKRFRELGKPADWAFELAFANLIGGFIGGRLWSVVENWSELDDLLQTSSWIGVKARRGELIAQPVASPRTVPL